MADVIRSIRSLPLYELISAPLVAMIQADAQAAKATLEFIETVGFVAPSPAEGGTGEDGEASQLRMAEFRYQKLDENNEISEFVASVPVLSLLPVPAVQIKEAKISFSAKIAEITREREEETGPSEAVAVAKPQPRLLSWIKPKRHEFLTKPVASSGPKDKEERGTYHLEIEISLGQADIPLGMERIFNLMDQAIQEKKAPSPQ
jgi:hypothetical protein